MLKLAALRIFGAMNSYYIIIILVPLFVSDQLKCSRHVRQGSGALLHKRSIIKKCPPYVVLHIYHSVGLCVCSLTVCVLKKC